MSSVPIIGTLRSPSQPQPPPVTPSSPRNRIDTNQSDVNSKWKRTGMITSFFGKKTREFGEEASSNPLQTPSRVASVNVNSEGGNEDGVHSIPTTKPDLDRIMECMEAARALKSSFCLEKLDPTKLTQQQCILDDNIWCVTALPGDDFSIDEFFNLPNEEIININNNGDNKIEEEEEYEEEKESNCSGSLDSSREPVVEPTGFSSHLVIPDDDMQELELWSHFMDDSVPEPILACPKPIMEAQHMKTGFDFMNKVDPYTTQGVVRVSFFPTAVPVKPRSKRPRTVVNRTWFTGSPPKSESSSSSSPSSPVSTLLFASPVHYMGTNFAYGPPPVKKHKKNPSVIGETGLTSVQRRCSHCQVTKTPQWRAGPHGPKSLCNACGVRFKSGRLFPEYRPACSPTFSSTVHSNSHRKVLEMRRKKEVTESFTGLVPSVSSS